MPTSRDIWMRMPIDKASAIRRHMHEQSSNSYTRNHKKKRHWLRKADIFSDQSAVLSTICNKVANAIFTQFYRKRG